MAVAAAAVDVVRDRCGPVTVETGTEATATTIVLSFKLMSMYNETKTVLVC